jgi:hypothetical protein
MPYKFLLRVRIPEQGEQRSGLKPNTFRPIPELAFGFTPEYFPQVAALDINAG